jgi:hypothetical protein
MLFLVLLILNKIMQIIVKVIRNMTKFWFSLIFEIHVVYVQLIANPDYC